ncbi:MAG: lipocalin family protein [Ignavibacteriales bacterium]|nr:lipocalin family protein [Ignavibacteriales bacterium]
MTGRSRPGLESERPPRRARDEDMPMLSSPSWRPPWPPPLAARGRDRAPRGRPPRRHPALPRDVVRDRHHPAALPEGLRRRHGPLLAPRRRRRIDVVNVCRKDTLDGKERSVRGKAWIVDRTTNAKLKVRFLLAVLRGLLDHRARSGLPVGRRRASRPELLLDPHRGRPGSTPPSTTSSFGAPRPRATTRRGSRRPSSRPS